MSYILCHLSAHTQDYKINYSTIIWIDTHKDIKSNVIRQKKKTWTKLSHLPSIRVQNLLLKAKTCYWKLKPLGKVSRSHKALNVRIRSDRRVVTQTDVACASICPKQLMNETLHKSLGDLLFIKAIVKVLIQHMGEKPSRLPLFIIINHVKCISNLLLYRVYAVDLIWRC